MDTVRRASTARATSKRAHCRIAAPLIRLGRSQFERGVTAANGGDQGAVARFPARFDSGQTARRLRVHGQTTVKPFSRVDIRDGIE